MSYYISRQAYYPHEIEDGRFTVEVTSGGLDNAGPDMLTPRFRGEGQEYDNPVEAVEVAFRILKQWQKLDDDIAEFMGVGTGSTVGGMLAIEHVTREQANQWAQVELESMPQCDECGDRYANRNKVRLVNYSDDFGFCSEYCAEYFEEKQDAESFWWQLQELEPVLTDEVYMTRYKEIVLNPDDTDTLDYCGTVWDIKMRFLTMGCNIEPMIVTENL